MVSLSDIVIMTMLCDLEPVEYEAEKVGGAGLYLQQGADKDGSHRETVAGGHGRQGPGHPHLAPLYLPPRLQHPGSGGQVRSAFTAQWTRYLRVKFEK